MRAPKRMEVEDVESIGRMVRVDIARVIPRGTTFGVHLQLHVVDG